ncbi:MAG TPA: helix-turn-helix domain-containing protein [Candidatus Acidoferrales bacterium]|nr:helix-turn-helix domain-containing protein [Candidatus Acidoferrales bacterium]
MKRIVFAVPPDVEIFDLAGPAQVFHEAASAGAPYRTIFAAQHERLATEQRIGLCGLQALPGDLGAGDTIVVPGSATLRRKAVARDASLRALTRWLRSSYDAGATVTSVCVGAFALAAAELLDGRIATTHWKRVDELQRAFPRVRVVPDRLYVFDGRIATSAGVASGVDLALAMVERDCGPRIAAAAAREMVVTARRPGTHQQLSPCFALRDHTFAEVHVAQDWLVEHAGEPFTLASLAAVAGVSERTLTRRFRAATGSSVKAYATALRLEHARTLLRDRNLSVQSIAERCGFADARALRRLWRLHFANSPSQER